MWMHHDLGWWGFVLAVIALAMAYPLNVFANLTSPVLKNWWAERSTASMRKRIVVLEKQLDDSQQYEELRLTEVYVLKALEIIVALGGLSFGLVLVVLLMLTTLVPLHPSGNHPFIFVGPIFLVALFWMALTTTVVMPLSKEIALFRQRRSPIHRTELITSIATLKGRLATSANN
jgi:hypothetical protein